MTKYSDIYKIHHLHFLGIGGISMSTLALIAHRRGYKVTGYDRAASPLTARLENEGIRIFYETDPAHVTPDCAVVYTAAISPEHPELAAALAAGIPCIPRAEYLGGIMTEYGCRIGVSGTHGKSTTTTMLAHIFDAAKLDPTVACGAVMPAYGGAYRIGGDKKHFLYESCEYTDSFLHFHPTTAVILNIEMDHVDYFHSMEQLLESFTRSADEAEILVVNADDENAMLVGSRYAGKLVPAGINNPAALYKAENLVDEGDGSRFTLTRAGEPLCEIFLPAPGRHYVSDALCALAAAIENGVEPTDAAAGIAAFQRADRRFEEKGVVRGARLFDDYAHHPSEIAATLRSARPLLGEGGKLVCLFQPHTYSRTVGLLPQFIEALSLADEVVLAPIYAAREKNTYGVSSENIAEKIPGALTLPDFAAIADYVYPRLRGGDLVLTMGAGDIWKVGTLLLEK